MRRFPWLTVVVFSVTLAVNVAQFAFPRVLDQLQRMPAGLHGQWWRTATALLVQDGGALGTASNLAFLAVLGVAAEQAVTRPRWLMAYLGAAAVGEFAGYAWQPIGGGNSVAVCGLAAVCAVALWRDTANLPVFALPATALWLGALLSMQWYPLIVLGIVVIPLSRRLSTNAAGRLVLGFAVVVGAVLTAMRDIHGAALLAGLVIAPLAVRRREETAATAVA